MTDAGTGIYVMTGTGLRAAATVPGPPGPQGEQGIQGIPGEADEYYAEFQFISPLSTWPLTHNQATYGLSVETEDLNGDAHEGTVRYVSPDLIEVDWYYPMSGLARVFT